MIIIWLSFVVIVLGLPVTSFVSLVPDWSSYLAVMIALLVIYGLGPVILSVAMIMVCSFFTVEVLALSVTSVLLVLN